MSAASSAFQEYLADDEPIFSGTRGTLIDRSRRIVGSIGVTDRRVLFVSGHDRFMDLSFDAIDSIQSHTRAAVTIRAIRYWGMLVIGVGIAIGAFLGMMSIDSSLLAVGLTVLTIGGTITAEYTRRHGLRGGWTSGGRITDYVRDGLDRAGIQRQYYSQVLSGENHDLAVLGLGLVATTALLGLVAVTESLSVIPFAILALGGIALAHYGNTHRRILNANDGSRRHERTVSIHLSNGRTVHLRVDATARIDHEISRLARETTPAHTDFEWPDSNADRNGGSPRPSRAAREPVDSSD